MVSPIARAAGGALLAGLALGLALTALAEAYGLHVGFNTLAAAYFLAGLAAGATALALRGYGKRAMIASATAGGAAFMFGFAAAWTGWAVIEDGRGAVDAYALAVLLLGAPALAGAVGAVAGSVLANGKKPSGEALAE